MFDLILAPPLILWRGKGVKTASKDEYALKFYIQIFE